METNPEAIGGHSRTCPSCGKRVAGRYKHCSRGCASAARRRRFNEVEALRLWDAGLGASAIARILGATRAGISSYLRNHRTPGPPAPASDRGGDRAASEAFRLAARAAGRERCDRCGYGKIPEILHVHHRNRDRRDGSPGNLALLCPTCHDEEHFRTGTGRYERAAWADGA